MAYYSPYTDSPVISAIGGLRETIQGLSKDYLQKKETERQSKIDRMEQERQMADIQSAQALALARTEAEERYKTQQHGLALKQFGETQGTSKLQRKALTAQIAEREHGQQKINLRSEFGYDELSLEDQQAFNIILAPLADEITRDEYIELVPIISNVMGELPSIIKHKEKEKLIAKLKAEAADLNPTSTMQGFPPNGEPVQNFAQRVRTETNGEYELAPVKWVEELKKTAPGVDLEEEVPELTTTFQDLTPMGLHSFRNNKLIPEPGVRYGYFIQPTRTIPSEAKKQAPKGTMWPIYPFGADTRAQPRGASATSNIMPAMKSATRSTSEITAESVSSELDRAGVRASKQDFIDMVLGKINVQDYIMQHKGR